MPKKHRPSLKHLLATSASGALRHETGQTHDRSIQEEDSVINRLARSRAAAPRTALPTTSLSSNVVNIREAWHDQFGNMTAEEPPRRVRTAGPAAPRSWQIRPNAKASSSKIAPDTTLASYVDGVTKRDLVEATDLLDLGRLSVPTNIGVPRLLDCCYRAIIRNLDNDVLYWDEEKGEHWSIGGDLRDQIPDLPPHSKAGILANHASHPKPRLSDKSLKALHLLPEHTTRPSNVTSWDEEDLPSPKEMVHHLSITLHPHPHRVLRIVNNHLPAVALTSINLAYSFIPADIEKMVRVLPTGLKELGLVGVRSLNVEDLTHALEVLAKRFMVLEVSLDPYTRLYRHLSSCLDPRRVPPPLPCCVIMADESDPRPVLPPI
jgi:hypothetical protein